MEDGWRMDGGWMGDGWGMDGGWMDGAWMEHGWRMEDEVSKLYVLFYILLTSCLLRPHEKQLYLIECVAYRLLHQILGDDELNERECKV